MKTNSLNYRRIITSTVQLSVMVFFAVNASCARKAIPDGSLTSGTSETSSASTFSSSSTTASSSSSVDLPTAPSLISGVNGFQSPTSTGVFTEYGSGASGSNYMTGITLNQEYIQSVAQAYYGSNPYVITGDIFLASSGWLIGVPELNQNQTSALAMANYGPGAQSFNTYQGAQLAVPVSALGGMAALFMRHHDINGFAHCFLSVQLVNSGGTAIAQVWARYGASANSDILLGTFPVDQTTIQNSAGVNFFTANIEMASLYDSTMNEVYIGINGTWHQVINPTYGHGDPNAAVVKNMQNGGKTILIGLYADRGGARSISALNFDASVFSGQLSSINQYFTTLSAGNSHGN